MHFKRIKPINNIKQKIKKRVLKILNQKSPEENVFDAKFPKFNKKNINQRLNLIKSQFGMNTKFKLEILNERCLKIYK